MLYYDGPNRAKGAKIGLLSLKVRKSLKLKNAYNFGIVIPTEVPRTSKLPQEQGLSTIRLNNLRLKTTKKGREKARVRMRSVLTQRLNLYGSDVNLFTSTDAEYISIYCCFVFTHELSFIF